MMLSNRDWIRLATLSLVVGGGTTAIVFSQPSAAPQPPNAQKSEATPGRSKSAAADKAQEASDAASQSPKSGSTPATRRRGPGMVGLSVEYDDLRCQAVQRRYSTRIPEGTVILEVDGARLPLRNTLVLAAAPAPYLFLPRGVHQVRFRPNEASITVEIEKDFIDEYRKMRRFFNVEHDVRHQDLLQRAARAMDVHAAPFLLNFLGAGYAAQTEWEAATRTFERALAVNPGFAPAHLNLAECCVHRGDRKRAIAQIDLADAFNVGNVFGITSAITRLRKELQLPPDQSSSAELTLTSYETTENISEEDRRVVGVLRALAKYAVQDEERCKILNNIGAHFADCGKPQMALAHFHNALAFARVSGPERFQLARQILSHMRNTCRKAGFAEAADYDTMMAIVSP